jgi:trimeric autotransporter adhesin
LSKSQLKTSRWICLAAVILIMLAVHRGRAASEHVGQVTHNGVAVPGATVTASQGDKKVATSTNQQGLYRFADLAEGAWTIRVEVFGFAPATKDITISAEPQPVTFELALMPFEEIARNLPRLAPATAAEPTTATAGQARPGATNGGGFQRTDVTAAARTAAPARPAPAEDPAPPPEQSAAAADGLLVNGSVNNGAASPFAQPAAFGNNRRSGRSLYSYVAGVNFGTSKWDSPRFSFTGVDTTPSYTDTHVIGTFQGPLNIPGMLQRRPNLFLGFQHTEDHNATSQSAIVPTALERAGDFSQSVNALGQPITVINPQTGLPFSNNQIPSQLLSPQAAALLRLYPLPNLDAGGRFNFESPILRATRQDSVQSRITQPINQRNQLLGTVSYQRTTAENTSLFNFEDRTRTSVIDTTVTWSRRFNQFFTMRPRGQFTQQTNETTPFFANRSNISGDAGILGNNQLPTNWGPPQLVFSSGIQGLSDALPAFTRTRSMTAGTEAYWYKGRHNLTIGGDARQVQTDVLSQQDPRGRFTFNGAVTGSDLGDFLLGIPRTTSIANGNADKYFRSTQYDAYVNDDLRLSPSFTVMLGARWEYEAPITEKQGRLVNLDTNAEFTQVAPVLATDPTGQVTGNQYVSSLIKPDKFGVQPRLALAWRPVPGSSLVVRAAYGIYRNTNVYQAIANLLAQQPPLSRTFNVENSPTNPVTLANAFAATAPTNASNTFAVDPELRVGYAQNWNASVQRDFPASLTVTASYLGTHGNHLLQQFLPNSYPLGAVNPCPTCPAGFIYLVSDGVSNRHAGQIQVRRRLRNGLTWTANYTLAKAEDDATAFSGPSLGGGAIAQNWLDLDAEYGPSSFDQRHNVTAQVQYTTGVGVTGGGLLTGLKGALIKNWTVTANLNAGSGLPVTPIIQTEIPGTGVLGAVRADLTSVSPDDIPEGYYLNPAAYTIPSGHFGTAGRNSARGPKQFGLNMSITRTFVLTQRFNMDWRADITNLLNRVTYSQINTIVGSRQFGLPTDANTMRQIKTSVRLRF